MSKLRTHLITLVAIAMMSWIGRVSAQTPSQSASVEAPLCRNTLMRSRVLKDPGWKKDASQVHGAVKWHHRAEGGEISNLQIFSHASFITISNKRLEGAKSCPE